MAFDTRNKCRICGMTCDFPGQVYCRNCLAKRRRQEEDETRRIERELYTQHIDRGDDQTIELSGKMGKIYAVLGGIAFGAFFGWIGGIIVAWLVFGR